MAKTIPLIGAIGAFPMLEKPVRRRPQRRGLASHVWREKLILALARWAKEKMGKNFEEFFAKAKENLLDHLSRLPPDTSWETILAEAEAYPIQFPKRLGKKSKLGTRKSFLAIKPQFDDLKRRVTEAKQQFRKDRNRAKYKKELAAIFPGVKENRLQDYCRMGPKEMCDDYLGWRQSHITGDAFKKWFKACEKVATEFPNVEELEKRLDRSGESTILTRLAYDMRPGFPVPHEFERFLSRTESIK